jgi:DNA-binding Lrp family transcriptional regulator
VAAPALALVAAAEAPTSLGLKPRATIVTRLSGHRGSRGHRPNFTNINDIRAILISGAEPMKLDRIDVKILNALQKNGRMTNVELSEMVNLSPSPCLLRVKKLQAEGYIEGYSAQINIGKLGQTLTVFTEITLKHRPVDFVRFLAAIQTVDQVIECHLVSGSYDYLVKFITAGIEEYQTLMERLLESNIGIQKYVSFVVEKSPLVKAHLPVASLFQQ